MDLATLERNVLEAAARARRIEEVGGDCTRADEEYMDALFALHDFEFETARQAILRAEGAEQ